MTLCYGGVIREGRIIALFIGGLEGLRVEHLRGLGTKKLTSISNLSCRDKHAGCIFNQNLKGICHGHYGDEGRDL